MVIGLEEINAFIYLVANGPEPRCWDYTLACFVLTGMFKTENTVRQLGFFICQQIAFQRQQFSFHVHVCLYLNLAVDVCITTLISFAYKYNDGKNCLSRILKFSQVRTHPPL